jgi:hypothetical protein
MRGLGYAILLAPAVAAAQPGPGQLDIEAALRAGGQHIAQNGFDEHTTRLVDGEIAVRPGWYSFALFGAYSELTPGAADNLHDSYLDLGARARVHHFGAFAGVGVGVEVIHEHDVTGVPGSDSTVPGLLLEAHVGYDLPRLDLCHCALQAFGAVTTTASDGYQITSLRFAFGLHFLPEHEAPQIDPSFPPVTQYALRLGAAASSWPVGGEGVDQSGTGPLVDTEIMRRMTEHFSAGAFGALYSFRDLAAYHDFGTTVLDMRDTFVDLGIRMRLHVVGGAFLGAGAGIEMLHEAGTSTFAPDGGLPTTTPQTSTRTGEIIELHAGYTFPPLRGVAPQLIGFITQTYDVQPEAFTSLRIAAGAQF